MSPRALVPLLLCACIDLDLDADLEGPRLVGGDLLRTLGGPSAGPGLQRFPIDLLRVEADGRAWTAVAHVIAAGPLTMGWRGPVLAVMNADRRGAWDVAPRAHPNDGRADVVDQCVSIEEQRKVGRVLGQDLRAARGRVDFRDRRGLLAIGHCTLQGPAHGV